VKNLILVVGSGFGDAEGTLPYLTGEWSTKFDYPPMPFDGILFGSRVMVAKENLASKGVKELIAAAPGVSEEALWERSYKVPVGGIVTVTSELGEPIHNVANRGVMFWKEMDEMIFSLPKEKRMDALTKNKDYIIRKMNSDYQKPWFGVKEGIPCDLEEMTYKEVAYRMLELLFVKHQTRWIDTTLRETAADFLRRIEERFATEKTPSLVQSSSSLDADPYSFYETFFNSYSESSVQTLTQEDVFFFLSICSYPNRKPVPFIPVLDERFEFWLKKDSLWQSEDLDAVIDQDPERVVILQGPVAVRHANKVDEPIKDILGNIYSAHIEALKAKYYGGDEDSIPSVEYLGPQPKGLDYGELKGVTTTVFRENVVMHKIASSSANLPSRSSWLHYLSGPKQCWLHALLKADSIARGKSVSSNPISEMARPRSGQRVIVQIDSMGIPSSVSFYSEGTFESTDSVPAVSLSCMDSRITLTINEKRGEKFIPLQFFYTYRPEQGHRPIHEDMEVRLSFSHFYILTDSHEGSKSTH
jgi:fatty acid synthase subunit alpha, fungi type